MSRKSILVLVVSVLSVVGLWAQTRQDPTAITTAPQGAAPVPAYPPGIEPRSSAPVAVRSVLWEYSVVYTTDKDALEAMLNARGQQGWEAMSIRETGQRLEVVFKRPKGSAAAVPSMPAVR
jgi:hypothetical protein